jgi:hypothetical protein
VPWPGLPSIASGSWTARPPTIVKTGRSDGWSSIGQVIGFDRKATRSASLRGSRVPRRWLSPLSYAPAAVYNCTAVYWSMAYSGPWTPTFSVPLVTMPLSESPGLNELTGWSVSAESVAPSSSQARTGMISRVRCSPHPSRSTEPSVYSSGCWTVTGMPSRMARALYGISQESMLDY